MERRPEPELMDEAEQARAYAAADFDEPHNHFVELLSDRLGPGAGRGRALDLGCGPGDISFRLAAARPGWAIEGVDGSRAMLELAEVDPRRAACRDRVTFTLARLPDEEPAGSAFELVLSNSLLHHLDDPLVLWRAAAGLVAAGGQIFVMDLARPGSPAAGRDLVARYAAGEPEVLRRDFHASLLAAYRVDEISAQLAGVGLGHLTVEMVSDRHWIAHGSVAGRRGGEGSNA